MIANQDPDLSAAVVDQVDTEAYRLFPFRSPTALDVFAYADRQRDLRLAEPADDVLQALTIAQSEGVLDEREFHNYFGVLMIAGNETTRHTISHGMLALMEHPEQLQLLRDEPELIPSATEEILRWASPVLHFRRTATDDVELRGQPIAQGDKVVTWYISANRDDEVFPDPYTFDVTRTAERARDVRAGRPALLPRCASRAARDEDPVPGADPASRHDRADGTGRAHPIELRERHQAHARARDHEVAPAWRPRGSCSC